MESNDPDLPRSIGDYELGLRRGQLSRSSDQGSTTDQIYARIGKLFSEVTGIPQDKIIVKYFYSRNQFVSIGTTEIWKDIATQERQNLNNPSLHQNREPKLVLNIGEEFLKTVPTDDELVYVMLHEYFHERSSPALQKVAEEVTRENLAKMGQRSEESYERFVRRKFEMLGTRGLEFYSDLMAQEFLLRKGYYHRAAIDFTRRMKEKYGKDEENVLGGVLERKKRTHPRWSERLDALQYQYDLQLSKDGNILGPGRKNVPSRSNEVNAIHQLLEKKDYGTNVLRDVETSLKNSLAAYEASIRAITTVQSLKSFNGTFFTRVGEINDPDLAKQVKQMTLEAEKKASQIFLETFPIQIEKVVQSNLLWRDRLALRDVLRYGKWRGDGHHEVMPTVNQKVKESQDRNDARLFAEATQEIRNVFLTVPIERQTSELESIFFKHDSEWARESLMLFPRVLREFQGSAEKAKIAKVASDILFYGEDKVRRDRYGAQDLFKFIRDIPAALYCDVLSAIQDLSPTFALDHANTIATDFAAYKEWKKITPGEIQRLARELSTGIARLNESDTTHYDLLPTLKVLQSMGVDLNPIMAFLPENFKARHRLEDLLSWQVYPTEVEGFPVLNPVIDEGIRERLSLFELYFREPEQFKKRVAELKELYLSELNTKGQKEKLSESEAQHQIVSSLFELYKNIEANPKVLEHFEDHSFFSVLREKVSEEVKKREQELLTCSDQEFIHRVKQALSSLLGDEIAPSQFEKRRDLEVRKIKEDLPKLVLLDQIRSNGESLLSQSLLHAQILEIEKHPALKKRVQDFASTFLLNIRSREIHSIGERLIQELFTDRSQLKSIFTEGMLQHWRVKPIYGGFEEGFDHRSFTYLFGPQWNLSDVLSAPVPDVRKLEMLEELGIRPTSPTEMETVIRTMTSHLSEDLRLQKTTMLGALQHFQRLRKYLGERLETVNVLIARRESEIWKLYWKQQETYTTPEAFREDLKMFALNGLYISYLERDKKDYSKPFRAEAAQMAWSRIHELDEKLEFLEKLKGEHLADHYFFSPEQINSLFAQIMNSSKTPEKKAEAVSQIRSWLTVNQLEMAWKKLSADMLYSKPYNEKETSALLKQIYGSYLDAAYRKMDEVAHRFELKEAEIVSLRDALFSRKDQAGAYTAVDLIRLALQDQMKEPRENIEFIRWLHGKIKSPPALAIRVEEALRAYGAGDKPLGLPRNADEAANMAAEEAQKRVAKQLTAEKIWDVYQSNRPEVRLGILSDMISPNNSKGLLATPEGTQMLDDYLFDGLEKGNTAFAGEIMRAFVKAMGEDGHVFLGQILASTRGADSNDSSKTADWEKVKTFGEHRGTIYIKLLQQLAGDPYLVPDPEVRAIFKVVLDRAAVPERLQLVRMFENVLADHFKSVEVHNILGSGSINVSAKVTVNGRDLAARMVKGDPNAATQNEMDILRKVLEILKERAETTSDPALAQKLKKMYFGLGDYLEMMATKIGLEGDLSRDKGLAANLQQTYNRTFSDLNVESRLVEPIPLEEVFGKQVDGINEKRIVFFPFIQDEFDSLTKAEKMRVMRAALRAEWEGIADFLSFDPDGHPKNWIVTRDSKNPQKLILHRIDYSQADRISSKTKDAFLKVMQALSPQIGAGVTHSDAFEAFQKLVALPKNIDIPELREHFNAEFGRVRGTLSPPMALAEIVAQLKENLDPNIHLQNEVQVILKSIYTSQQLLDRSKLGESKALAEEFARTILRKGYWTSKLYGIGSQGSEIYNRAKIFIAKRLGAETKSPAPIRHDSILSLLDELKNRPIDKSEYPQLVELYNDRAEYRGKIISILEYQFMQADYEWAAHRPEDYINQMFEFLSKNDLKFDQLLGEAVRKGQRRAFRHILAFQKKELYSDVYESLRGPRWKDIESNFNDRSILNDDFISGLNEWIRAHAKELKFEQIADLNPNTYPAVREIAPIILEAASKPGDIDAFLRYAPAKNDPQFQNLVIEKQVQIAREQRLRREKVKIQSKDDLVKWNKEHPEDYAGSGTFDPEVITSPAIFNFMKEQMDWMETLDAAYGVTESKNSRVKGEFNSFREKLLKMKNLQLQALVKVSMEFEDERFADLAYYTLLERLRKSSESEVKAYLKPLSEGGRFIRIRESAQSFLAAPKKLENWKIDFENISFEKSMRIGATDLLEKDQYGFKLTRKVRGKVDPLFVKRYRDDNPALLIVKEWYRETALRQPFSDRELEILSDGETSYGEISTVLAGYFHDEDVRLGDRNSNKDFTKKVDVYAANRLKSFFENKMNEPEVKTQRVLEAMYEVLTTIGRNRMFDEEAAPILKSLALELPKLELGKYDGSRWVIEKAFSPKSTAAKFTPPSKIDHSPFEKILDDLDENGFLTEALKKRFESHPMDKADVLALNARTQEGLNARLSQFVHALRFKDEESLSLFQEVWEKSKDTMSGAQLESRLSYADEKVVIERALAERRQEFKRPNGIARLAQSCAALVAKLGLKTPQILPTSR